MGIKLECGPHTRRAPRPNVAKSSLVQAEIPTVTSAQLQRYSRHATNVRHSGRPRGWDLLYHSARKGLQDHGRRGKTPSPYHQSMLVGALHCDRCPVNTCCPSPPTLQGISVSAPYGLDHSGEYTRPSVGSPARYVFFLVRVFSTRSWISHASELARGTVHRTLYVCPISIALHLHNINCTACRPVSHGGISVGSLSWRSH